MYSACGNPFQRWIDHDLLRTLNFLNLKEAFKYLILFFKGDQKLSNKEFIKVLKKRYSRGLHTRKDTGFINFIESASECAKETLLF